MAQDKLDLLASLIDEARRMGADAADAVLFEGQSQQISVRLGAVEDVERSEAQDLGLRVFIGQSQAIVSSTDFTRASLSVLVERAVAMARNAPADPFCGLADPADLARPPFPDYDLHDPTVVSAEELKTRALAAEEAALAVKGVSNSEGAGASAGESSVTLVASNGFAGHYRSSSHSVSVSVLAGEGTGMERDYDFSSARHLADLESPEVVGRRAGELTVRRLNPRKIKTAQLPLVFDPRVSRTLLGHLAGAVNGQAIARGTSFLKSRMGEAVFAPGIRILDNATLKRGLSSRPFDGEGLATQPLALIDDGVLRSWVLDTASAKQLGLKSTGHARRGASGPPGPGLTNLYMEPGTLSPRELMADIKAGFYVTELIGMGVNGVTGDYSRGAAGFWIENGEIAHPVSEVTIAGNLIPMFKALVPANDLVFRYGTDAPTIRIDGMTVAGS